MPCAKAEPVANAPPAVVASILRRVIGSIVFGLFRIRGTKTLMRVVGCIHVYLISVFLHARDQKFDIKLHSDESNVDRPDAGIRCLRAFE